jgi:tetratricopeptide (TPR) repeat protein
LAPRCAAAHFVVWEDRMRKQFLIGVSCVFILSVAAGAGALAAGGGGGGGISSSVPAIDPQKAYRDGVTALKAGDYKKAAREFKDVLSVAPKDTSTNYLYGLALVGNQKPADAKKPLERAVQDPKAPADAWLQLGLVYLQTKDRPKADAQLKSLATMIQACDAACGDARRGELQNAHDSLEKALLEPAPAAAMNPNAGWSLPGVGEGRADYAKAVALINSERYEDALAALNNAEMAIGPNPDILNYKGFASRKLGRFDASLGYYQQALAINPDHIGANEYLGELYLQMGRKDDAKRQLARLDALCPFVCAQREELARWIMASN